MTMEQIDMRVRLGGLELKNPVMPASGTYDYFECNANVFPMSRLGAVMVKSVHRNPRSGNPAPRITEVLGGMINAVGIPSAGIEEFMSLRLPQYAQLETPVILSLSGNTPEHYYESAEIVANDARIGAIELNLSCPNVGTGLPFSSDPQLLRQTVSEVRRRTTLPLFVKLSPNVTSICETAQIAEACGADAVTIANTYRAMKIDISTQKPVLGNISGGMSGPAIKPQTLFLVYQAYKTLHIPIIACGGITCWQDAVEYLLAGASALQVGCINFVDPMAMAEIIDGLAHYMSCHGYRSLDEFRGNAQQ